MHPFIEKYISSFNFPTNEWGTFLSKENELEAAILYLNEILNKFDKVSKLNEDEIDKALIVGHEDADVFLFFVSLSIVCLSQQLQLEKAKSLVSIGKNLLETKIQPAIQAVFLQVCSRLKLYCGDLVEEKRLMAKSLSLLQKDNPRYQANLTNYSYMLARSGMLNDLDAIDKKLLLAASNINKDKGGLVYEIIVANCIMQADFEKGFEYLKLFLIAHDNIKTLRYDNACFSLNILSGNHDLSFCVNEEFKSIALVVEGFYQNNWDELPEKISIIKAIENTNPFIHFITKYLPIHLELYNKNVGKVKIILQENQKAGKAHFLDDLFYARIALLENNKPEALFYIKRLMLNVSKYNFEKRLVFELQFAKELSAADFYFLFQKAEEFKEKNLPLEETFGVALENLPKGLELIVGSSTVLSKVKKLIQKFSVIPEPILVTGATGTGKELVAQALHDIGPNAKEPFLAINCGSLTDTLLQSELFGYEAGAFTGAQRAKKGIFESAGKGTVFLDEFEDVSPKMQSSLLRVLETNEIRLIGGVSTRKINCKIVVATNVALKSLVANKIFREDLYFRLARFEITLPALKHRKSDIPELLHFFLSNNNKSSVVPVISQALLDKLTEYEWPGNIRELKNAVERMQVLHADKKVFGIGDFDFEQLENFSGMIKPVEVSKSKEIIAAPLPTKSENIEELARIQNIINKGFKIESRGRRLKELFGQYKKLSRSQVVEILQVSPLTASNTLEALCREGFVIKKMPSKSTKSHYYEWKE